MDERMACLWTTRKFAKWKFELSEGEEPTEHQLATVSRMCKNGSLPARKIGKEWRIDVRKILEVFDENK